MIFYQKQIFIIILNIASIFQQTEIIDRAKEIGTYETSILPYDDCCSVFAPAHPLINPKLDSILRSESKLNIDELVDSVLATLEIL